MISWNDERGTFYTAEVFRITKIVNRKSEPCYIICIPTFLVHPNKQVTR